MRIKKQFFDKFREEKKHLIDKHFLYLMKQIKYFKQVSC